MMTLNYAKTCFLLSAAKVSQLPPDSGAEFAFVGRSNAGKSSALNVLTQQNSLARVSKTPGRTRLINVFPVNESVRLIDLPGYGYAKVPPDIQREWETLIQNYVETRKSLKGLVLLMDSRHPLKPMDEQLIAWAGMAKIPTHILLTKSDKLTRNAALKTFKAVEQALRYFDVPPTLQLFSALKKTGLTLLQQQLEAWLDSHQD